MKLYGLLLPFAKQNISGQSSEQGTTSTVQMSSFPIVVVVVLVSLPLYRGFVMEEGHGTLISNEIGATCDKYKIINCKVRGSIMQKCS